MSELDSKEHATSSSCIYCGSSGPFNNEHVFCAGLGGDDSEFMLRNLVCQVCNTERFSPLEAEFMRSSPEAFARVFLQPRGRDRKKQNSGPKFRPESLNIFLPNGGGAEAEIKAGGQVLILPQFWLAENRLHGQCSEVAGLRQFIAELSALLELEALVVVTKSATKGRSQYGAVQYSWDGQRYTVTSRTSAFKAPKLCIWRDTGQASEPSESGGRIFRRSEGQVVFRTAGGMTDVEFLTVLRVNAPHLVAAADAAAPDLPLEQPSVRVRMRMNIGIRERVLAKIGVNVSTYIFGDAFIRQPCFDEVKAGILTGEPGIFCTEHRVDQMPPDEFMTKLFTVIPRNHHVCILTALPIPGGGVELLFCVRLYGGILTMVRLARGLSLPVPETPVFLIVNYVEHQLRVIDAADFATDFLFPELGQARQEHLSVARSITSMPSI